MIAGLSLLLVLTVSVIVIRVTSVALGHTGMGVEGASSRLAPGSPAPVLR